MNENKITALYTYYHTCLLWKLPYCMETTCQICRNVFNSIDMTKICGGCDASMDEYMRIVRDFLYECPNAAVAEVCSATAVPFTAISYLYNAGRIEPRRNGRSITKWYAVKKCIRYGQVIEQGERCFTCEVRVSRPVAADTASAKAEARHEHVHRVFTQDWPSRHLK